MANGNGGGTDNWPWWLRVSAEILKTHGVSAAIALYLVWQLSANLGVRLERIEERLTSHAVAVDASQTQFQQLVRITRANCLNNATSPEARDRCNQ